MASEAQKYTSFKKITRSNVSVARGSSTRFRSSARCFILKGRRKQIFLGDVECGRIRHVENDLMLIVNYYGVGN